MGLQWVLFSLTGTLVDPTVLAQPLGATFYSRLRDKFGRLSF